jgi:serine protease Do
MPPLKNIFLCFFILFINITFSQIKYLDTYPSNAKILNEDDIEIGTTPININELNSFKYTIKKDGFISVSFNLEKDKKKAFETKLNNCENCFAKKNNSHLIFSLIPKNNLEFDKILVGFENPELNIDENQIIGYINKNKKTLNSKNINNILGFTQNMETRLFSAFNESYIQPKYFDRNKNKKNLSLLQSPKIIFKPIINQLNFDLNGKLIRDYNGTYSITIDWEIFDLSNLDKELKTIKTTINIERFKNNYNLILHELIYLSQFELLKNTELKDFLKATEIEFLEKTIAAPIKIELISNNSHKNNIYEITSSVVTIETENKFGSGFFISNNGYIVTNYHVLEGENEIYVRYNNKRIKAEIIRDNKSSDLLLLKIDETTKGLQIINTPSKNLGEDVYAIGTPVNKNLDKTVTKGIISGTRVINGVVFLQTDVSINPGNSGGPLVNQFGQVVGINTLKANGDNINGIGFAIESGYALKMLNIIY